MKARKAAGPSEVCAEMIAVSGEIGIGMMVELCHGVLDGRGMPDEWALGVMVPIFKIKEDALSCEAYRRVKLLEHAMESVEKVLERRLCHMVKVDAIWFYARQRNGRCSVYSEEVARGILRQGKVV